MGIFKGVEDALRKGLARFVAASGRAPTRRAPQSRRLEGGDQDQGKMARASLRVWVMRLGSSLASGAPPLPRGPKRRRR